MPLTPRSRAQLAASAIFALALLVRIGFWEQFRDTALDRFHEWNQTDMATYLEQARQIAAGDWWAREPYHPYHSWQSVAPPEQWLEWYGPRTFHQAPGYAYALAIASQAFDDPLPWMKALQLVLGAVTCVLVFAIGRRTSGLLAGCAAGVAAALYAPLFYLEPQLLREGPAICALLLILLLLLRLVDGPASDPSPSRSRSLLRALCLGVAIGLFYTFHELATATGAVAAAAVALRFRRAAPWPLVALLLGCLVGFAPLLLRNVVVGAPAFSASCRTTINFVESNEAHAFDGGATFAPPGPEVVEILDAAQGSLLRALPPVWRSYDGDAAWMLRNWLTRFARVFQKWEAPDNTSLYFYAEMTKGTSLLPDFRTVFPLGFAAMLWWAGRQVARSRFARTADREADDVDAANPSGHAVLLGLLAALVLALSFVHVVARFRLYLVPVFLIYLGLFIRLAVTALRARRITAVVALLSLAGVGFGFQELATRDGGAYAPGVTLPSPRQADLVVALTLALRDGEDDLARRVAELAFAHDPGNAGYFAALGGHLERRGDDAGAALYYRRALEIQPDVAEIRAALERALGQRSRPRP